MSTKILIKKRKNEESSTPQVPQKKTKLESVSLLSDTVTQTFLCPITHFLMVDPVLAEDGHTYERDAIETWLSKKCTSPFIPSKRMKSTNLLPVRSIREAIKVLVDSGLVEKNLSDAWKEQKRELNAVDAKRLYKKGLIMNAAKLGYPKAQSRVSYFYFNGMHGLEKDYDKAMKWAMKAAGAGEKLGQSILGYIYELGFGVEINLKEAKYWYKLAAKQGDITAMYNLSRMCGNDEGTKNDYIFLQKAITWYQNCANAGCTNAMLKMGKIHYKGEGFLKNHKLARRWFHKAYSSDEEVSCFKAEAGFLLGKMMIKGLGGPRNISRGCALIETSASRGCIPAMKMFKAIEQIELDE